VERRLHHANDGRSFQITTSLGVATLTEDRNTAEKLLHAADEALYHAKDEGRNQVVMAPLPPDQQLDMLRIPRTV
jgi:diguanylate cyclase (GGDEF)-like protein